MQQDCAWSILGDNEKDDDVLSIRSIGVELDVDCVHEKSDDKAHEKSDHVIGEIQTFATQTLQSNCEICGDKHTGECLFSSMQAYQRARIRKFKRSDAGRGKGKPKCYNCGKRGHIARDCWSMKRKDNSDSDEESELDDATMRKAIKQLKRTAAKCAVTVPDW